MPASWAFCRFVLMLGSTAPIDLQARMMVKVALYLLTRHWKLSTEVRLERSKPVEAMTPMNTASITNSDFIMDPTNNYQANKSCVSIRRIAQQDLEELHSQRGDAANILTSHAEFCILRLTQPHVNIDPAVLRFQCAEPSGKITCDTTIGITFTYLSLPMEAVFPRALRVPIEIDAGPTNVSATLVLLVVGFGPASERHKVIEGLQLVVVRIPQRIGLELLASGGGTHDLSPHEVAGVDAGSLASQSNLVHQLFKEGAVILSGGGCPAATWAGVCLHIYPQIPEVSVIEIVDQFVGLSHRRFSSAREHVDIGEKDTSILSVLNVHLDGGVNCSIGLVSPHNSEGNALLIDQTLEGLNRCQGRKVDTVRRQDTQGYRQHQQKRFHMQELFIGSISLAQQFQGALNYTAEDQAFYPYA